jgi:hypothetical protein
MGDIVLIHSPLEIGTGKKLHHIRKRCNAFIGSSDKGGPVTNMLFRPEEIHGTSGKTCVFKPFPERHGDIGHESTGFLIIQNLSVLDNNPEGFAAIQAGGFYGHCLPGEEPADRQRLKGSLAEPFLLTFNGDAVLGGQIIERGEGGDEFGAGVKPSGNSGGEKIVKCFSPFFHRETEFGSQFRVKRGLAGFHHTLHDGMKGLVKDRGRAHGVFSLWGVKG